MTVLTKVERDISPFSVEMGDWLHCNTCYKQPGDGRCYFLTSCGHLYCEGCRSRGWTEKCLLCGTNKPSALKLTAKLTPPVDAYFSEPIKMLKHVKSQVTQVIATMEFQHHQRKRYISQLQKTVSNHRQNVEHQERELKAKIRMKIESMEKEIMKLKEENSYFKRLICEKSLCSLGVTKVFSDFDCFHQSVSAGSPSAYDRHKYSSSPVQKGYGSPGVKQQLSRTSSTSSLHKRISPGPGIPMVTSDRVSVRTPPSGGRMVTTVQAFQPDDELLSLLDDTWVIPQSTPSPLNYIAKFTPKSVPHPIGFDVNMETPP